MPENLDEYDSLGSEAFIESNDRNPVVTFSYSEGINQQFTLHDDPTYFIGWEVYIFVSHLVFKYEFVFSLLL